MCLGKRILYMIYISTYLICLYMHRYLSRCFIMSKQEVRKMFKRQWRASSKPKSSLISLHRSCNQQDFQVIWDHAEMVAWKASLIFTDYFIAALSFAFTVLPGPDRPLPQWYLLTKRTRFASLHPPFRWSKLPISAGRIPFLLKSVFLPGKPPLYMVKSSILWVKSTICMVKWS